jgi:hypothetical protein
MAYDYINYDPDVEKIKQKTFKLLDISSSFFVKTYPDDNIDGNRLKKILKKVRNWCIEAKKTHKIKSIWYMTILLLEDKGTGLSKKELLNLLSKNESDLQIPDNLRKVYGNFGYRYILSRSFNEVVDILSKNRWIQEVGPEEYSLTIEGLKRLKSIIKEREKYHFNVAAYGNKMNKIELLTTIDNKLQISLSRRVVE